MVKRHCMMLSAGNTLVRRRSSAVKPAVQLPLEFRLIDCFVAPRICNKRAAIVALAGVKAFKCDLSTILRNFSLKGNRMGTPVVAWNSMSHLHNDQIC